MIENIDVEHYYTVLYKLKKLPRSGWVRRDVENPESVAEHSFSLAMLVMMFVKRLKLSVDLNKVLLMALLHDIGETVIGDITPHDNVSIDDKHRQEAEAVQAILQENGLEELFQLWKEFEECATPEAKLVFQLDKMDAYLQARQYQLDKAGLDEFAASTRSSLTDEKLIELLDELENRGNNKA
ncbi:HD domain-containing protein [Candidatus Saccharibacteria bacterium]|nr:HD domain-containing protein [Candidatus Saccharibacteria bacterium]